MKKINYKKYFENKKITLMGLGGFSRSLKEAEFLAKNGADLIITDLTPEKDLEKELEVLKKYKNIKYTLGEHKISDFKNRDIVFSANGVPLGNKFIETAKEFSEIVTKTATYVFWILQKEKEENNLNIKTIGITGTKGKSTTTSLIVRLLEEYLKEKNSKNKIENSLKNEVFVGGNVRGTANLTILPEIKDGDFFVAELDSWLLQGFESLKISPEIAIFTNFFNDHQNYYHSMEKYYKDKSFIFKFQKKDDIAIFTNQSREAYKKYFDKRIFAKKIIAITDKLPEWNYTIFGEHNENNIAQALEVAKFLNISKEIQKKAFENYEAEEGRFQKLEEKKDIIFYNDNNATMPEASIISIKSLKNKYKNSKIFLLAGGTDKNFSEEDYEKLAKLYEENVDYIVFFEGSGTEKVLEKFSENFIKNKTDNFEIVCKMKKAFESILKKAQKNKNSKNKNLKDKNIIILSPALSSFGCFKNEYDKNDQFLEEYNNLEK